MSAACRPPRSSSLRTRRRTSLTPLHVEQGDVSLAEKLVSKNKKPTHHLPIPFGFLPFGLPLMDQKLDSIAITHLRCHSGRTYATRRRGLAEMDAHARKYG